MKNAENRASYPYDERKTRKITLRKGTMNRETAKNGFPVRGKTKNQRKILSQNWEDEKMWKIGFPNIGKNKKWKKWLSQHWEDRKTVKKCLPKLGKNKKSQRLYFPTLGRTKNIVGSFPNPLDERFFLFFIHSTPRTGCFSDFLLIRGLGRAFQCVAFHQSVCCLV